MKYWMFGLLAIVLISVWQTVDLAASLFSQKQEWENRGIELAKAETDIAEVEQVTRYNGMESYLVVQGKTGENIPLVAWFQGDKLVKWEYKTDLVSQEDIRNKILSTEPAAEFHDIRPGLENQRPIWEALFTDQDGYFNYYYYDMKTGEFIRSYRLQKDHR